LGSIFAPPSTFNAGDTESVNHVTREAEGDTFRCLEQLSLIECDPEVDVHELS